MDAVPSRVRGPRCGRTGAARLRSALVPITRIRLTHNCSSRAAKTGVIVNAAPIPIGAVHPNEGESPASRGAFSY